ncbi:MAG: glycosyltransferase family 2 protein [Kiritimatiellae bacterium]|nr:glycosyltransferase family 2 protein [Kiritimatiellia bacterium]
MPRVSVVMPVFNTKTEYFKESINSILGQSFNDFELLIIDNGSDCYVADIVKSYSDKKIKYFKFEKNQGPAIARNKGIDEAEGEYIAFIDSDDISLSQRLEKQVEFLDNNFDVGCLGTAFEVICENPNKMRRFNSLREHFEIECYLVFTGCTLCQSSIMIRKSILDKCNIRYRPEWVPSEDYGLFIDLVGKTKFKVLDDILVKYRLHRDSTSNLYKKEQREESKIIQAFAINKYCNMSTKNKKLFSRFILDGNLKKRELVELAGVINDLITYLCDHGCPKNDVMYALKRKIKNVYYHTRSFRGQWNLMVSPINKIFNLSLFWRLMCLTTRGIFK